MILISASLCHVYAVLMLIQRDVILYKIYFLCSQISLLTFLINPIAVLYFFHSHILFSSGQYIILGGVFLIYNITDSELLNVYFSICGTEELQFLIGA